jgi:integrase
MVSKIISDSNCLNLNKSNSVFKISAPSHVFISIMLSWIRTLHHNPSYKGNGIGLVQQKSARETSKPVLPRIHHPSVWNLSGCHGLAAYVIPKGYYPVEARYVPFIYTTGELKRFFTETDQCSYCYECPYRHLIMPLFFRMIYTCGLRVSEAGLLTVGDVDLEKGILSVHHSKKDNSRLVPMSEALTERCRSYSKSVHPFPRDTDTYFSALGHKPMTIPNVYHNFYFLHFYIH